MCVRGVCLVGFVFGPWLFVNVLSSFSIISRERELTALLILSDCCDVAVSVM